MKLFSFSNEIGGLQGSISDSSAACLNRREDREMNRTRVWYRYQRRRAIHRKAGILRRILRVAEVNLWTGGKTGKLSKGKIHCSCWMCRHKSRDEHSASDQRKESSLRQQMKEEGLL